MATKHKTGWMGRVSIPGSGGAKRKTKIFPRKKDAEAWENLMRRKLEEQAQSQMGLTATASLHTLLELRLDNLQTRKSPKHYDDNRRAFRLALEALNRLGFGPTTPAVDIPYAAVEAWLNEVSTTISGSRANRYRKYLVAAWAWGAKALRLPRECPWHVESYREQRQPRRVPSVAEFWAVHEAAALRGVRGTGSKGAPAVYEQATWQQRLLLAYLYTAARKDELLSLEWKDVDFDAGRIRLWTNKRTGGREFDWIPMVDDLAAALREQRFDTGLMRYVFINSATGTRFTHLNHFLTPLCNRAEVEPFGFHGIRHLSASILDAAGLPLTTIQAILRHRSATTTSRYLHSLRGAVKAGLDTAFGQKITAPQLATEGR